jgi:hypothetical protein
MVGFDGGSEPTCILDGREVGRINSDLTYSVDTVSAKKLIENEDISFMGTIKVGPFELDAVQASQMLSADLNPNDRPNSDVIRP